MQKRISDVRSYFSLAGLRPIPSDMLLIDYLNQQRTYVLLHPKTYHSLREKANRISSSSSTKRVKSSHQSRYTLYIILHHHFSYMHAYK